MSTNTLSMPNFFVLTQDGHLYGYFREDVLKCDLSQHRRAGQPAEQVWEQQASVPVVYAPAERFQEFTK